MRDSPQTKRMHVHDVILKVPQKEAHIGRFCFFEWNRDAKVP